MKINSLILADLENMYTCEETLWKHFKDSKVMISGAYGMLASYLVWMFIFLNEKYDYKIEIIAIIRDVKKMKDRFGDFCEKEYITCMDDWPTKNNSAINDVNYIFHAASLASPQYYQTSPVDVAYSNAIATYNLLEYARNISSLKSFILFSSGAIYGEMKPGKFTEDNMGIVDPLDIRSCYAESKRMAENWCKCFYVQYDVPCKIARISHTFGPTMDIQNDRRVFSEFVKNAIEGDNIIIKGDGNAMRPFCYISDCIRGIIYVTLLGKNGEAYNVNRTDTVYSIREVADIVSKVTDYRSTVMFEKRIKDNTYVESINNLAYPCNEKILNLGWKPLVSIEEGFEKTIKAQREMRGAK